jgi:hypothetical protein
MSRKTAAFFLAAVAFVATFLLANRGVKRGAWVGDERHKIAESYYVLPLERADWGDPFWYRSAIERTNPPVGKYVYGFSIQLHGMTVPKDPLIWWTGPRTEFQLPPEREKAYAPLLVATRRVAVVAIAAIVAALVWTSLEYGGFIALLVVLLALSGHYLTRTLSNEGVFDMLQTALMTFAVLIAVRTCTSGETAMRRAIAGCGCAAALMALAFQVRLNGILGVTAIAIAILASAWTWRAKIVVSSCAALTFIVVAILVNPYYWSVSRPSPGVAELFTRRESIVLRIPHRFTRQLADVNPIVNSLEPEDILQSPAEKAYVVLTTLASGKAGKLICGGLLLMLYFSFRSKTPRRDRILFASTAALVVVVALWIPISWPRYVYPVIPLCCLCAGIGFQRAASALLNARKQMLAPR